jgi:hypothetical protein
MHPSDHVPGAPSSDEQGATEAAGDLHVTVPYAHARRPTDLSTVRRFRLTVVEGPGTGATWESASDVCGLGSHPLNDFPLEDSTVSRFHQAAMADRTTHGTQRCAGRRRLPDGWARCAAGAPSTAGQQQAGRGDGACLG